MGHFVGCHPELLALYYFFVINPALTLETCRNKVSLRPFVLAIIVYENMSKNDVAVSAALVSVTSWGDRDSYIMLLWVKRWTEACSKYLINNTTYAWPHKEYSTLDQRRIQSRVAPER